MYITDKNSPGRKGNFLWMDDKSREKYLEVLKKKIQDGYYNSDNVIGRIVDDLAPIFNDSLDYKNLL